MARDEGLIKDYYEVILRELQSVLAAGYVLMVAIGMLYNYFRYEPFGINIFEYADVLDFLIAPFEDILILLITLVALLIPYLLFRLDVWYQRRFPRSYHWLAAGQSRKPWYNRFRSVMMVSFLFYALVIGAMAYGSNIERNIHEEPLVTFFYSDGTEENVRLIGKTHEVYFVHTLDHATQVVPITASLLRVELLGG